MNKLIAEWNEAKKNLDKYKKLELELREKVIKEYPGDLGTTHTEGRDFKLTITRGVTRAVDQAELAIVWEDLNDIEKACISYKPNLDARLFDKLPPDSLLSRAITVKPSLPTVKVEVYGD